MPASSRHWRLSASARTRSSWRPADDQGRFDASQLPDLDERTLLILQAGNVNSGAFDPFLPLCQAAREAGAWTHIDGAFGLWARACRSTAHLGRGLELADSWSVDAHKTLNSPYDCGIVLCRDRGALVSALQASDAYIQADGGRDGMLYSLDMSRRARGIELWAALKSLGRDGLDQLIAQLCQRARQFADELRQRALPHSQRCRLQSSPGRLRELSADARDARAYPGRRRMLVRRLAMAGRSGDSHQRLFLDDDRSGHSALCSRIRKGAGASAGINGLVSVQLSRKI